MIATVSGTVPAVTTLPVDVRPRSRQYGGMNLFKAQEVLRRQEVVVYNAPCLGETGRSVPVERRLRGPNGVVIEHVAGSAARAVVRQGDGGNWSARRASRSRSSFSARTRGSHSGDDRLNES